MSRDKREFEYDSLQDTQSIVKYLTALADGFEKGLLKFSDKNGELQLEPRGLVDFGVRASKKRERTKVVLTFTWKPAGEDSDNEAGPLFITVGNE